MNFSVYWIKLHDRWKRKDFVRLDEAENFIDNLDEWCHAEIWFIKNSEPVKKYVYLLGGKVEL